MDWSDRLNTCLSSAGAIGFVGGNVKAFPVGLDGGESDGEGEEEGCFHFEAGWRGSRKECHEGVAEE